jgi:hypothetical protein
MIVKREDVHILFRTYCVGDSHTHGIESIYFFSKQDAEKAVENNKEDSRTMVIVPLDFSEFEFPTCK